MPKPLKRKDLIGVRVTLRISENVSTKRIPMPLMLTNSLKEKG